MATYPKYASVSINLASTDWVISDIHGCIQSLKSLIRKIKLEKGDRLFLLGDLVNKGPSSIEVMDYLMNLEEQGFNIYKIKGNHDLIWLKYFNKEIDIENESLIVPYRPILASIDAPRYKSFLEQSFYYIEVGSYFLVHAGFNFEAISPLEDYDAMTSIRSWNIDDTILKGRNVIYGHFPTTVDDIKKAVKDNSQKIPLDNGCVYFGTRPGLGSLMALNLNKMEIVEQLNVDQ